MITGMADQIATIVISSLAGAVVGMVVAQLRVVEPIRKQLGEVLVEMAGLRTAVGHVETDVKILRAQLWEATKGKGL